MTDEVIDLSRFHYEQPPWYTTRECFIDYSRERLIQKGKNCLHAWIGFNKLWASGIIEPQDDVTKIIQANIEDYIDWRTQVQGVNVLTVRRELTFVKAAIGNAYRRNRIKEVPYIELPDGEMKFRRPLTEDEFQLVIRQPMSERLNHFYWGAYHTGHRSRAIEEWTWDRTNLAKRMIDFNVPGRIVTNKRRAKDFPIHDDLLKLLLEWKETAKDNYVIGLSPRGLVTSTYHEAVYVVRELAGLTDPTLVPRHCMRKMYATELFEREANPEVVGHLMADDPKTLKKHYVAFKHSTLLAAANLRTKPMASRGATSP